MRILLLCCIGVVCAEDLPPPSQVIDQTASTIEQERSPAYIRHYLEQQYQHAVLQQQISLELPACSLAHAVEQAAQQAHLSLFSHIPQKVMVPSLRVADQSIGQVLHALLAGRKPAYALLIVHGVVHIGPQRMIARRARQILSGGTVPHQSAVITLAHGAWSESFKLGLEAMWRQCTREHIGSSRRQYFFLDDTTRQVFVQGTPEQITQFKQFTATLEHPLPQVALQAHVISCNKDLFESLGVTGQWRGATVASVPAVAQEPVLTVPYILTRGLHTERLLDIVLHAAERRNAIQTLLAPRIVSQHGKTAQLLEGQRVPIEATTQEQHDGKSTHVRSASYKEVGMQLKVTPRVLANRTQVQLEVLVENSQLAQRGAERSYPTITTSHIKNTVRLESGQTVILGGLIRRTVKKERYAIPYLSRVPLLGWLFSSVATTTVEQRLYVLLRARLF